MGRYEILESHMIGYLKKSGFNIYNEKPIGAKLFMVDTICLILYSVLTIRGVIIEEASILILILNTLCFIRGFIKNCIENKKFTILLKERKDVSRCNPKYHHYLKALVQIVILVIVFVLLIVSRFDMSDLANKSLVVIMILCVIIDELDQGVISVFGAYQQP